jgi:hypothetical protein
MRHASIASLIHSQSRVCDASSGAGAGAGAGTPGIGAGLSTSYLNFLIDVLGGLGCKLRDIVSMAEDEDSSAAKMEERGLSEGMVRQTRQAGRLLPLLYCLTP